MSIDASDKAQARAENLMHASEANRAIKELRKKLLDLSGRNVLLNYKHPKASCLRIIDELPDQVLERLAKSDEFEFSPIPEPRESELIDAGYLEYDHKTGQVISIKDMPTPKEWAKELDLETDYELPNSEKISSDESKHLDLELQTMLYAPQLEGRLKSIRGKAESAINETGANILYLVLGFLEWYEDENSNQPRIAPLVTIPVALERGKLNKSKGAYTYKIKLKDDGILNNITLGEKLKNDFGLALPEYKEDESPEAYFLSVENALLANKQKWRIRRFCTLALLNFSKQTMYLDLDPENWPKGKSLTNHPTLLRFLSSWGNEETGVESAGAGGFSQEEHPIDEYENIHTKAPLIFDADSSQHSAIIDVIYRKKNLVIEGPPGTGKSQTITNLIAAAIGQGMKVLFVAEKMAALNVVKNRLDNAGLGNFCLELHSHKTNKKRILEDLQSQLSKRASYRDVLDLDEDIARHESFKKHLAAHADLINKEWANTGISIHKVLTKVARLRVELDIPIEDISSNIEAESLTSLRIKELIDNADILRRISDKVGMQAKNSDIRNHPWFGVQKRDANGLSHQSLFADLEKWTDEMSRAESHFLEVLIELGLDKPTSKSLDYMLNLCKTATSFPKYDEGSYLELLPELLKEATLAIDFGSSFNKLYLEKMDLSSRIEESVVLSSNATNDLQSAVYQLKDLGFSASQSVQLVFEDIRKIEGVKASLSRIKERCALLADNVPSSIMENFQPSIQGLSELHNFIIVMSKLPRNLIRNRSEAFDDDIDETIRYLNSSKYEELRVAHFDVATFIDTEKLPSIQTLNSWHGYESRGILFRLFSSDAKRVWNEQRSLYLQAKPSRKNRKKLEQLISYREGIDDLANVLADGHSIRQLYKDFNTNVGDLAVLRAWYKAVRRLFGNGFEHRAKIAEFLFSSNHKLFLATLDTLQSDTKKDIQAVLGFVEHCNISYPESHLFERETTLILDESDSPLMMFERLLSSLSNEIKAVLDKTATLETVVGLTDRLAELHASSIDLVNGHTHRLLKDNAIGVSAHIAEIDSRSKNTVIFMSSVLELAKEHPELAVALSQTSDGIAYEKLKADFKTAEVLLVSAISARDDFIETGLVVLDSWSESCGDTCANLIRRNNLALSNRDWLATWQEFLRLKEKLASSGLERLMSLLDQGKLSFEKLSDAIALTLMNVHATDIFDKHPELRDFSGLEQSEIQRKFKEYDQKILTSQRKKIAYRASRSKVVRGNSSGRVGTFTEGALITHEIGKKTRHIPVRDLVIRSKRSIQALKPCFMMSPMSVAQYLKPGEFEFDIVVMDEASQIRPEDALGTIARGSISVVVGDPKQLPPTNFFQKITDNDVEDDDAYALQVSESILDAVLPIFDARRLRWHYRSRHESLIAFSNKSFYDSDLVIYPSPYQQNSEYGIRYTLVEDGRFVGRKNSREAKSIAEAARKHILRQASLVPDQRESLGLVAMSADQRSEIEAHWDSLLKDDSELRSAYESVNSDLEPFFIKNLENVQGDDRDIIMISMTYGPETIGGRVMQRFGPINSDVGWRRLNVLFTRSKKRMHIFSSMASTDIVITPSSKRGVIALKGFLEYCETGHLHQNLPSGKAPDSDFEVAVINMLKAHGYDCEAQLGIAGYYLDLAVRNPDDPGHFLMGIECDGATYHSAKSTRDRDRLRQEILESLGWKIQRIWSTDWFKNPQAQITPIVSELEKLRVIRREQGARLLLPIEEESEAIELKASTRAEAPESHEESDFGEIISTEKELRKKLTVYNQFVISKQLLETSDDKRLLRPAMLEALVHHRPTSKIKFVQLIPTYLREGTDVEEAKKFLGLVLEMISDHV